jgi:hypothetical protein
LAKPLSYQNPDFRTSGQKKKMNLLDSISGRFEIKIPPKKNSEPATEPGAPCSCGCCRWWLPVGQSDWRCETCSPPPSRSLVARWSDATPGMTSELLVTFCRPWCESCGGWQGRERNYSDWSSELACATCGAELPEAPRPRVSKETEMEVSK